MGDLPGTEQINARTLEVRWGRAPTSDQGSCGDQVGRLHRP